MVPRHMKDGVDRPISVFDPRTPTPPHPTPPPCLSALLARRSAAVAGLMRASPTQLEGCPGIGPTKARRLYAALHEPFFTPLAEVVRRGAAEAVGQRDGTKGEAAGEAARKGEEGEVAGDVAEQEEDGPGVEEAGVAGGTGEDTGEGEYYWVGGDEDWLGWDGDEADEDV